jgi:RNA polymerase sigma-32 factor
MHLVDDARTQRATHDFIKATMAAPLLSREREVELARRWREHADERALHELVRAYARLAVSIATRFRGYGMALGDLIQEGNVGLMQAAARFEPDRGVRFSTYAAWWIKSAMQDFVLRNWSVVRVGSTAAQKSLFFNLRRLRARIERAGVPLDGAGRAQIAALLDVSTDEVAAMEQRLAATDQALDAPLSTDGRGNGEGALWRDRLADRRPDPEATVIVQRDGATRARWLAEALGALSPRERQIIGQRRLAERAITLEALGRELNLSKERVRQLENRALSKLRDTIARLADDPRDLLLEA